MVAVMERSLVVGVLAGLSGRSPARATRFRDVDLDTLDDVIAALAPEIETGLDFAPRLAPRSVDDLHPEALARSVPALAKLAEARERVAEPEAVRSALAEIGVDASILPPDAAPQRAAAPASASDAERGAGVMDDLLSGASTRRAALAGDDAFARLVREITAGSVDRTDHARLDRWRDAIGAELGRRLRALLAAPAVRELDARWRALRDLVRRAAGAGGSIEVRVLDLPQDELAAACAEDAPIESTLLHRLVVEDERGTPGGRAFGLLLADYTFADHPEDRRALARLGEIARRAEAPLLANASAALWTGALASGAEGASPEWRALLAAPFAQRVALCAPRVLVRLPYGQDADPVDAFPFEEIGERAPDDAGALPFAGGAWLVAAAALDAWTDEGSLARTAACVLRDGLPFFTTRVRGETAGVGPTERVLSEAEAKRLADAGLVPIAGLRGQDAARIVSLQSVAGGRLF
jgi:type VI secretion system ImpC/EvpB family protein